MTPSTKKRLALSTLHPPKLISGLALSLLLAACGGSGGSDQPTDTLPSTPPATSVAKSIVGTISGFGSVYVNGVRYDTTGASYDVDDSVESSDSALAVGMVVKIDGEVNSDGLSGTASSIYYDDELEGIVEDLSTNSDDASVKTFVIMNTMVRVHQDSTNFDGEDDDNFDFDTLMNGDHVEVSGDYEGDVLVASYIEKQESDDDDFEVKGTVTDYDGASQFLLMLRNGNTLDVTLAAGATIPSVGIQNGQFVEVEGTIPDPISTPDSLLAIKVELEDDDRFDDDDQVEIKGILSYDESTDTWSVRDVPVSFSETTEYDPEGLSEMILDTSAAGLTVEVEGSFDNGTLRVTEIELEDSDLEFKGNASVIDSSGPREGTVRLSFGTATGTVDVAINRGTVFLDDEAANPFNLTEISDGTKVEIDARFADDGTIVATALHLEDDAGYEITGPLDEIGDVFITVLGVTFSIDETTFFEDGTPAVGDLVEIEDENGDGFVDFVEIEDDD